MPPSPHPPTPQPPHPHLHDPTTPSPSPYQSCRHWSWPGSLPSRCQCPADLAGCVQTCTPVNGSFSHNKGRNHSDTAVREAHVQQHARTHAQRARAHTHTHARAQTRAHTHAQTRARTPRTHTHMHARTHEHIHITTTNAHSPSEVIYFIIMSSICPKI